MNNEKTPEDKLREAAAAHTGYMFAGRLSPIAPESFTKALCYFAKSKEASEYHQSLQPKVDVEKFVNDRIDQHYRSVSKRSVISLLKEFDKTRLQPAAPESDAVEILRRLLIECRNELHILEERFQSKDADLLERVKEAITKYKQSKTNSDAV